MISQKHLFMRGRSGPAAFTLIELLVVIAIIALLLSIVAPALRKAKDTARALVCSSNLKTLALANDVYAARRDNWYVPVIDTTMTARGEPTWNSNAEFRNIVGLDKAYVGSSFTMPQQYLCPADTQSNEAYWAQAGVTYQNFVSYGYNLTDWGPSSKNPASWSGNLPASTWSCRVRANEIKTPASRIMFVDAGDIWARMEGAGYKLYWDREGQDIVKYRARGMWHPVYYRHREGANIAFFDGHVEFRKKESLYYYDTPTSPTPQQGANELIWFCNPMNRKTP